MPSKKDCYGILDQVFPVGEGGLRQVVPRCMECEERVECLRSALKSTEGIALQNEMLDRAAPSGMVGRIKRWSGKKHLYRQMKKNEKKDKK